MPKETKKVAEKLQEYIIIIKTTKKWITVECPWSKRRVLRKYEKSDENMKKAKILASKKKLELLCKSYNLFALKQGDKNLLKQVKRQSKDPIVYGWRMWLNEVMEPITNIDMVTARLGMWMGYVFGKPVFIWFDKLNDILLAARELTGDKYEFPNFEGVSKIQRQAQPYD